LFDNLDVRTSHAYRLLRNGGSPDWEPTAGAFNTFWNIHIDSGLAVGESVSLDRVDNAPQARWVGVRGDRPIKLDYGPDAYIEALIQPITVPSLYEYQLQQRLSAP